MYDDDSELRDRLVALFGPGPEPVTADEAMSRVTYHHGVLSLKWSPRKSRTPRRTAFLWLGGVVVLIVVLVLGFGAGLGSNGGSNPPTGTGPGWHQITFGGLRLSVPTGWPVRSEDAWGDCGPAGSPYFKSSTVVLDTGVQAVVFHCPSYSPNSTIAPMYGIVVDPGPNGPLEGQRVSSCQDVNGLRLCPSADYGGIEVFAVYIPGRSQPVAIEIGLAGSGQVADDPVLDPPIWGDTSADDDYDDHDQHNYDHTETDASAAQSWDVAGSVRVHLLGRSLLLVPSEPSSRRVRPVRLPRRRHGFGPQQQHSVPGRFFHDHGSRGVRQRDWHRDPRISWPEHLLDSGRAVPLLELATFPAGVGHLLVSDRVSDWEVSGRLLLRRDERYRNLCALRLPTWGNLRQPEQQHGLSSWLRAEGFKADRDVVHTGCRAL